MWKIAFVLGMMLSLGVSANTCNVSSIEGVVALLRESPQEKHFKEVAGRLLALKHEEETRKSRPEFVAGLSLDTDNIKNQEMTAELLFNVDDVKKYSTRKKLSSAERSLRDTEYAKDFNERLSQAVLSMFKISQQQYLLEKIDGLLSTISSSESIYRNRPIRSRDDEIVLSSLSLLKTNLSLKKAKFQENVYENELLLKKWDNADCSISYRIFSEIIKNLRFDLASDEKLLSYRELKLKAEILQRAAQLESRRFFNNLKIGPGLSREKSDESTVTRFGVTLSFDLPSFDRSYSNQNYIEQAQSLAVLEKARNEKSAGLDKKIIEEKFKKYSGILQGLPSQEKLESDVRKMKKSFDAGVVSPLVYLESYRSYLDFLEVSEDVRLNVLQSYLTLRGLYVENNP